VIQDKTPTQVWKPGVRVTVRMRGDNQHRRGWSDTSQNTNSSLGVGCEGEGLTTNSDGVKVLSWGFRLRRRPDKVVIPKGAGALHGPASRMPEA